jgi:pimeloyl-ACP methyl ester carboxylesterase
VQRPRILLVPTVTELEWRIAPELAGWAEVATYDAPGVGQEPPVEPPEPAAVARRGLAEMERRGWERCIVVGDEVGAYNAMLLASLRPRAVAGIALGHPSLSGRTDGPRGPLNGAVVSALMQVLQVDYRSFARALTQVTREAYDDDTVERYVQRVPQATVAAYFDAMLGRDLDVESLGRELQDKPMLLAEHAECAMWTREGYEDMVAAFPQARTASFEVKPSASPEFAERLRQFAAEVWD